jgi:hypothetical protein
MSDAEIADGVGTAACSRYAMVEVEPLTESHRLTASDAWHRRGDEERMGEHSPEPVPRPAADVHQLRQLGRHWRP